MRELIFVMQIFVVQFVADCWGGDRDIVEKASDRELNYEGIKSMNGLNLWAMHPLPHLL